MDEYDASHPISKKGKRAALRETVDSAAESDDSTPIPNDPSQASNTPIGQALQAPTEDNESHLPKVAKYAGGKWFYGRQTRSRRTNEAKLVWKNAEHYTPEELDSDGFQQMRRVAEPSSRSTPLTSRQGKCHQPERLTPTQKVQDYHS